MDAANLLKKQGWRGLGHSLDTKNRGIARPLLITRRQEGRGLGSKKTQPADQWWMRAYDTGLKELGTGKQAKRSPTRQTELSTVSQNAGRSSLYMSFVKGGLLPGTIDQLSSTTEASSSSSTSASENSTTATTPEPNVAAAKNKTKRKAKDNKTEKKRKREGHETEQERSEKDGSQKKRKKKDRSNDRSTTEEATATEDPTLIRRAAKKALRLKRAESKAAELAGASPNSESLVSDADRDTAAGAKDSTRKKRKERSGPDAEKSDGETAKAQANADSAPSGVSEGISNNKMKKYAAKAAAKGMTVEAYLGKKAKSKGKASK
ncbi:hypothetical protein IWZ00DRAFT_490687 [Phyllosticta capitalensis]